MKKISKLLGVALTVTVVASLLLMSVPAGALSVPNVSFKKDHDVISMANPEQTITFTLGKELPETGKGPDAHLDGKYADADGGAYTLPDVGDAFTITAAAATDTATLVITTGTLSVTMSGTGTYTVATGVIAFAAIGETAVVAATAASTGTWAQSAGAPTAAITTDTDRATITVTYPSGYKDKITGNTAAVNASPGWISGSWDDAVVAGMTTTSDKAKRTQTYTLGYGDKIGEAATVLIKCTAGITNPDSAGDYTVTVETNREDTPVESATYAIKEPKATELPGIIDVYNKTGVKMKSFTGTTAMTDATTYATGEEWTLKISPGTYGPGDVFNTGGKKQKYVATGAAAETIWKGAITLDAEEATIEGITIQTGPVTISGKKAALKNCVLEGHKDTSDTLVIISAAQEISVSGCTFDLTEGDKIDLAIDVNAGDWDEDDLVTISGNTFTLDDDDTAIDLGADAIVKGNTINGAEDTIGITITGVLGADDIMEISGNTLDALEEGIVIDALNTVTIKDNTISNCATVGFNIDTATNVLVHNNIITGAPTDKFAMDVATGLNDNVFVLFNSITDNAKGLKAADATPKLDARNNWWGSDAGPGKDDLDKKANFEYEPWLTGPTFESIAMIPVAGATVDLEIGADSGKELIGVGIKGEDVSDDAVATAPLLMAAATYEANPVAIAPPGTATKFFDVYVDNTGSDVDKYTISLYGAVTEDSLTYAWGEGLGEWVLCESKIKDVPNFVNLYSGATTIYVTSTSIPTIGDLTGIALAIVEPDAEEEPTPAPTIMFPEVGAENVSVNPVLGWEAVEDAEGFGYEMAICEEPTFTIVDYAASPTQNFHAVADSLMYSTTYYWKVRAIIGAPELVGSGKDVKTVIPGGPWTTGVFSTEAEPAEPEAPVFTCPQCGLEYATQEALEAHFNRAHAVPETVVETVEKAVIPSTLLWAIVAIGAVLVIAVIVLIVRTRRVA